jgi:hypothetical protein
MAKNVWTEESSSAEKLNTKVKQDFSNNAKQSLDSVGFEVLSSGI